MCTLFQPKDGQQVGAVVTHDLTWNKLTYGQPPLDLPIPGDLPEFLS